MKNKILNLCFKIDKRETANEDENRIIWLHIA